MNTWVSYEVLPAFYTVDSFSGCFATELLTSHVHTSHMVVFDPWAHFPFWYRNDYTFSHTYTLRHAYLQEMFSNERNNLIYIWTCCLSASSWQQWLPSLQCPPSWDCKHSNVCISSDCYHWSSVWCSSHVAFKMTGSVGDCWTDP